MTVPHTGLLGVRGRPFLDLSAYFDLTSFPAMHEEICVALTQLPVDYTGGSHRSMGIMPPGHEATSGVDYGEVIAQLSAEQFEVFRQLADDPAAFDPKERAEQTYGEERALPLSRRQMLWLKYRHGVYFPWKVYVELMPNRWWGEKHLAAGKRFTRLAETLFPKTLAFVRALPFESLGRCNLMGLEGHDHGTLHRDGEGGGAPEHHLSFSPGGGKQLYLHDAGSGARTKVTGRVYWFNDHDYHGVEASPRFRYSLRVDGVFRADFLATLQRDFPEAP